MKRLVPFLVGVALVLAGCSSGKSPLAEIPGSESSESSRPSPTVTPPSPEELANKAMKTALDGLASAPGLHFKGTYPGAGGTGPVDMRVSASGTAYGTIPQMDSTVKVLVVGGKTFVRAPSAYWSGRVQSQQVKMYSSRWVRVDPSEIGDPSAAMRPSAVAAEFTKELNERGLTTYRAGQLDGKPVTVTSIGNTTFYLSKSRPERLLKVDNPRFRAPASRSFKRGQNSLADEEDEGLEFDEMDAPDIDDFYDEVEQEGKKGLRNAVDGRVSFNAQLASAINCPFGSGACTIRANVSNRATGTSSNVTGLTGNVMADMRASVSGPLNSTSCGDSKSMALNSSTVMTCVVNLSMPRCNKPRGQVCSWPVRALISVTARASINYSVLQKDLSRDRARDKDTANCPRFGRVSRSYQRGAPRPAALIPQECGITAGKGSSDGFNARTVIREKATGRRGETFHMDVETNGPGKAGNIHIQLKGKGASQGNKYYYRPKDCKWVDESGNELVDRVAAMVTQADLARAAALLDVPVSSLLCAGRPN